MFDLFGIRRKKEARKKAEEEKAIAIAAEKKKKYQERKAKIVEYMSNYDKEEREKRCSECNRLDEMVKTLNTTCPKCGSKDIVNKIVRTKGEIHGNGSMSFSSFSSGLFSSTLNGYGNSKIDGELDTFPINKCRICGHEWNIAKPKYPSAYNKFNTHESHIPSFLYRRLCEYISLKYDPYDKTEPSNSLEEMQEQFLKKMDNYWAFKEYRSVPKYMVDYAIYGAMTEFHSLLDLIPKDFEFNQEDDDCYSYELPDKLWEIAQKMIGMEGDTDGQS